jgi:hypothetical protein
MKKSFSHPRGSGPQFPVRPRRRRLSTVEQPSFRRRGREGVLDLPGLTLRGLGPRGPRRPDLAGRTLLAKGNT